MRLKPIEHWFRKLDELSHAVMLTLVAASILFGVLASSRFVCFQEPRVAEFLHGVHWFALALVLVYFLLRALFVRDAGKVIAKELDRARARTRISQETYEDRASRISPNDVKFVSAADTALCELLYKLNAEGFEGDPHFEMSMKEVEVRNRALLEKNPHTFMLLRDPDRPGDVPTDDPRSFIGYTAVFPLSAAGTELYFDGKVQDRAFHPALVAAQNDTNVTRMLWFAVVLRKDYRGASRACGQAWRDYVIDCTEFHLKRLVEIHCSDKNGVAWVQSSNKSLIKHLLRIGYAEYKPGKTTGDGLPLLYRPLAPEIPQPLPKEPWLAGAYAFVGAFIATFFLIWLLHSAKFPARCAVEPPPLAPPSGSL